MGYYSTLEGAHTFTTWCRSDQEIRQVFEQTFAGNTGINGYENLGYHLALREENGDWVIDLDASEYYQKHWYPDDLARLIQKLLAPSARTYLEFVGEDGERWGYAITHENILEVEFVSMVGGRPLDEWLSEAA